MLPICPLGHATLGDTAVSAVSTVGACGVWADVLHEWCDRQLSRRSHCRFPWQLSTCVFD